MAVVVQPDPRGAAHERDLGLRRIGRLTWRAGLAGAACSAVLALAFGHQADATSSHGGGPRGSSPTTHNQDGNSIVIPAQPPQSANGPSQVTSGGTSTHVP
jgi:hypothetical protein